MEDLLKLIEIAKKKGQRSIQLVNQNFRKKEISKDNLLYDGIISDKYTTDEMAAKDMFKADPGNRNYRNAKGKLKQKLLNHLYFLDYEKEIYTCYNKNEYECRHLLHQCQILINEGANDIAIKQLPYLIKTAEEFEFIDIQVEALSLLRNEHAILGKSTPFIEANTELIKVKKLQAAIHECEEMYYNTLVYLNKSVSAQNRILAKVPETISKIEEAAKKWKSSRLDILAHKLMIENNQLNWNFEDNIKICTKLEKKYLTKSNTEVLVDLDKRKIAFTKLFSFYCLNDAKNGNEYADKASKLFKNGSSDWFGFIEYHFLLMMKGQNYKKAGDLFRKVRTNKNFNILEESEKERWQIYRAFLVFVNDTKLLRWGFDLEDFLKITPQLPKDKQGYNISTLIIQFMFFLRSGDIEGVRKVVEDLQEYNSVHLDKRNNYRNSIFIRLLSIITEKEFNYEAIHEKGKTYYKKLVKTQIPGDLYEDMEVINYEIFWDTVLNILKTNKIYVHYRFYNLETA
jgi:hypothetical protein